MERMNKIATDEGFIIAVDSLVHNALDLAIGATKVDENNLLRKIRNDYKEEAMRQSSLPTGRGLLMAINTARGVRELEEEAYKYMRKNQHQHAALGHYADVRKLKHAVDAARESLGLHKNSSCVTTSSRSAS
ncbi:unnamed protein product [Bathycoccus prasinos]